MRRHDDHSIQPGRFLVPLCFVVIAIPAVAASPIEWRVAAGDGECRLVQLKSPMSRKIDTGQPFFIVTHGMNGTIGGDRFHTLAGAIANMYPRANVLIIDWSEASCAKIPFLGLSNPSVVANRIDAVGDDAAEMLCELGFRPSHATFIGESFGNWVNARIADQLGKVNRMLAMNPASELGGYAPPNLRQYAMTSWAFHTFSVFDTLHRVAQVSIFLQTPVGSDCRVQHNAGIERLTGQLLAGDGCWLRDECGWGDRTSNHFDAFATLDGTLVQTDLPMIRPAFEDAKAESDNGQREMDASGETIGVEVLAPRANSLASSGIR